MDLAPLADKLRRLRELENSAANWSKISYALNPPIGAAELEGIELAQGVRLPDDYRTFLLELGNGGAGPGYGLYPLAQALTERGDGIYSLADPFVPPRDCGDWLQLRAPGILPIHHDGCAYYHGLVISGPERGTVWTFVEVMPGWLPSSRGGLVDEAGARFELEGGDHPAYERWYEVMLLPGNRGRRQSFREHIERWADGIIGAATRS